VSALRETFINELRRIDSLSQVSSVLGWDEQVNLPSSKASSSQRSSQSSALAEMVHREFTGSTFSDLLKRLEDETDEPDEDLEIILREVRRDIDRAQKLPNEFVARKASHESSTYHVWRNAREKNDFAAFAPALEKTMQFAREEAAYVGYGENPYDYHLDKHDPGMNAGVIGKLFDDLQIGLVPLAEQILSLSEETTIPELKGFPKDKQETFLREVVESLGFDFTRGRMDVAVHPFCSGNGSDTRLTTRYDSENPLDSLFSAIHETGHGLYEQGLPHKWLGTPLGEAAGMGVHESQSRIWENQVGRSPAFWNRWEPRFRELFPEPLADISSEQLFLAINKVSRNPIRVDADEVTYNLHVILRFELEQALFAGDLKVEDLPSAWSEKAEKLLGLQPTNDSEGVLQDVHWSGGAFGYFPSYCLGNLLAAQLWEKAVKEDVPDPSDPSKLLSWLHLKVHRHGRRMNLLELTENATGDSLGPRCLLQYLESRYLSLYRKTN
jgi:carboxypeptidase Taq